MEKSKTLEAKCVGLERQLGSLNGCVSEVWSLAVVNEKAQNEALQKL